MRCSCPSCETVYMAQSEGPKMGCVCPDCGYRCTACLGTNTLMSREEISLLKQIKDEALKKEENKL